MYHYLSSAAVEDTLSASLLTTLRKLELMSETNRVISKDFYEYKLSKNSSERHIISLLNLLISLVPF